ncbi:MAG TPA: hypothetical protein PLA90_18995, partial [Candidatus Sumerlaeota bacterium]|nr:hypothetical protein [Candidatus Sumerlaeota bacterium]
MKNGNTEPPQPAGAPIGSAVHPLPVNVQNDPSIDDRIHADRQFQVPLPVVKLLCIRVHQSKEEGQNRGVRIETFEVKDDASLAGDGIQVHAEVVAGALIEGSVEIANEDIEHSRKRRGVATFIIHDEIDRVATGDLLCRLAFGIQEAGGTNGDFSRPADAAPLVLFALC